MSGQAPPVLPVLIVTGFLGSGKTTLVNRLLRDRPRSAVIVNEFGAVPIDQKLLEQAGAPLAVLSGGCLCCQVRNAMAPLLRNLWMAWRERRPFDRVVIETSGVASPGPVLDILLCDRWLAQRFRLEAVVTTVSAADGADQIERFPEAVAQIALADVLMITHGDLVSPVAGERLEANLARLAPATPRLASPADAMGFETLLALSAKDSPLRRTPPRDVEHGFRSFTLRLDVPVDWVAVEPLLAELLQHHADRLVRLKGIVQLAEGGSQVVIQAAAGRLYAPVPVAAPQADAPRGQLVFIGVGALDELARAVVAAFGAGLPASVPRPLH